MNRSEIITRLQGFCDRTDRITEMFKKNPRGYNEKIKTEYAELKNELKSASRKFATVGGREQASDDERNTYFPAVNEAWIELKSTRSGSRPNQKMIDNLAGARLVISFYLNHMKT